MGFGRNIIRSALQAALLLCAVPVAAAPAPEPLIVSKPAGAELLVTRSNGDSSENSLNLAMENLSRAIDERLKAEQEATESACRSGEAPKSGTPELYTWRARCSYQRH